MKFLRRAVVGTLLMLTFTPCAGQSQVVAFLSGSPGSCSSSWCGYALAVTAVGDVLESSNGLQPGGFHFKSNIFENGAAPNPVIAAVFVPGAPSLVAATAGGDIYYNSGGGGQPGFWHLQGNVFQGQAGARSLVSIAYCPSAPSLLLAMAGNGDLFRADNGDGHGGWTLIDNVFGSPTLTSSSSWGTLKVKYAPRE